ncbi:MAG: TIGR01777 family oxidoreductase, partial [Deltaproteobacteria bacterium]|nr:TIGR01777 family oxidoreductase [Deltaproteobacteria bacterium]
MIRVLMTGASGLIGSALASSFLGRGYALEYLVRRPSRNAQELEYRPQLPIAPTLLSHRDIIIHLAGESVVGRWTEEKKAQIRVSRVLSTRNLSEALVAAKPRPRLFLCASAIGYYGDRGEEILTERSSSQGGFLAELCREWEEATYPARDAGMRTVNLRIGVVLSRQGGALKAMLPAFRRGLGGTIGGGRQWWSWIDLSDLVAAVEHVV